jgi:predicted RNase H-like HicB family nuclease
VSVTAIYTARYTKIQAGYMGQLVEWPEVISEGSTLEECRGMLEDALHEMILAYRQQGKTVPTERGLLESLPVEV